ncbi:hypothetical protein [Streptomyces syringium]|uniref:hypothetical protein n=1 Tax=Streptomyces syringium TaxID=76729 RepID=UPI0033FED7A2
MEKGSHADLSGLEDPSKYADKTPYYVHYKLTKTAEGNGNDATDQFEVFAGGKRLTELMAFTSFESTGDPAKPLETRRFEKCQTASHTEYKEAAEGKSVGGCAIYSRPREPGIRRP